MKWLLALAITLLVFLAALFVLLFTPVGNPVVGGIIESQINKKLQSDVRLERFELSMSTLHVTLLLTPENRIELVGNYSLFSQAFDVAYRASLEKLESLEPLTAQKLQGPLHTEGKVVGDLKRFQVDGSSDIAHSATQYHLVIDALKVQTLKADIQNAKTEKLLSMLGKAPYAVALLNLSADMSALDPQALKGNITLNADQGRIDTALMQRDFNVTLPKTVFACDANAQLKGKSIDYALNLDSNLATVRTNGTIAPKTTAMDLHYGMKIAKLELFKPLTNAPLRGELSLQGTLKGNKERLLLDATSDLARSKTHVQAELHDFKPKSIEARVNGLSLERLLYMLEQPHYLHTGVLDAVVSISDATPKKLNGTITTAIHDADADITTLEKAFDFVAMPEITFESQTSTLLSGSKALTSATLSSNIADVHLPNLAYNMATSSLTSDYNATLHDLQKLQFLTKQKMRGSVTCNGEIQAKEQLRATFHTKTLGGSVNALLENDALHADLNGLQTLKLLYMLYYPEVFDSILEGTLDYALTSKRGTLLANMKEGKFTQNEMGDLLKQYAKYDLYQERFISSIRSEITQETIDSNLSMKGGTITIDDPKLRIMPKSQTIRSDLRVVANKNPLVIKLRGSVNHPKVQIDARELIEREAGKAIQKELGKLLNGFF